MHVDDNALATMHSKTIKTALAESDAKWQGWATSRFVFLKTLLSEFTSDLHLESTRRVRIEGEGHVKYERGDYIKVEFSDNATGVGEWMWVRVTACDDAKQLVFGTLDNVPVSDSTGKLKLGTELAISYSQVREHRKSSAF